MKVESSPLATPGWPMHHGAATDINPIPLTRQDTGTPPPSAFRFFADAFSSAVRAWCARQPATGRNGIAQKRSNASLSSPSLFLITSLMDVSVPPFPFPFPELSCNLRTFAALSANACASPPTSFADLAEQLDDGPSNRYFRLPLKKMEQV
jgi:hypothetical protein